MINRGKGKKQDDSSSSKDKEPVDPNTPAHLLPGTWGNRLIICPIARVRYFRFRPHELLTAPSK